MPIFILLSSKSAKSTRWLMKIITIKARERSFMALRIGFDEPTLFKPYLKKEKSRIWLINFKSTLP